MAATLDQSTRQSIRFEFAEVQPVSIALEDDSNRLQTRHITACLLNLSAHGAKLAVPGSLPERKTFRLKLSVQQFALEFYVAAKVCWTSSEGENGSVIGCQFNPSLPDGLLEHFAAGGNLDRRGSDREKWNSAITIVRELAKAGAQEMVALQNYSAGGFCVEARQPLSPGERFQVLSECLETPIDAVAHWQIKQSGVYLVGCGYIGTTGFEQLDRALVERQ